MQGIRWSAIALLALVGLACSDDGGSADTDGMCGTHGEDPDPCCCFPEPGMAACSQLQLCPTIEADCEDGTLGTGACILDQASDGAVTCALTALADPASAGSVVWTVRESNGDRISTGTLHLGGSRAALEVSSMDDSVATEQAFVGALPADFDADACAMFNTPGARFECMLNATALEGGPTCYDTSPAAE